jgi:hypothetical protein
VLSDLVGVVSVIAMELAHIPALEVLMPAGCKVGLAAHYIMFGVDVISFSVFSIAYLQYPAVIDQTAMSCVCCAILIQSLSGYAYQKWFVTVSFIPT